MAGVRLARTVTAFACTLLWLGPGPCLAQPVGADAAPLAGVGRFRFSARAAAAAKFPRDTSGEWYGMAGAGASFGALGLAAPPMYASALVVGGALIVPVSLIMAGHEKKSWQTAIDALAGTDLAAATSNAMQRRAGAIAPRPGATAAVEVVIGAFGLIGDRPDSICFVAGATLTAAADGRELLREAMRIASHSSPGMPPAQCASMDRFARDGGRLVRDTAAEYAEVLAAGAVAIVRRAAGR